MSYWRFKPTHCWKKLLKKSIPVLVVLFGLPLTGLTEELSEHLMTSVSGTQISGYISTTATWSPGISEPVFEVYYFPHPELRPYSPPPLSPSIMAPNLLEDVEFSYGQPTGRGPVIAPRRPVGLPTFERPPIVPQQITQQVSVVPEPGTMLLLGLGTLVTVARLRKLAFKRSGLTDQI